LETPRGVQSICSLRRKSIKLWVVTKVEVTLKQEGEEMKQASCKVLISDCTDPYQNLAAEELLLHYIQPEEVLLYLWQNDNTVVIGRNQNAWRECALEAFTAKQGKLARRLSGGGAVYHDMGNQNFTFFAHNELYDVAKQSDVICLAARKFGIEATRNGRNDITADDRKFSGNAYYSTGNERYHHGTILLSSNMSRLSEFLTPSKEKLQAKGVESVRSRVVNLCELAPDITPAGMRQALIASFEEVYGSKAEYIDETVLDKGKWDNLTEHYGNRQWTLGRLSEFNKQFRTRLSFGEVELQIAVSDGIIRDAVVYSDAMNADWADAISEILLGCGFDSASIRERLVAVELDKEQTEEFASFLTSCIS